MSKKWGKARKMTQASSQQDGSGSTRLDPPPSDTFRLEFLWKTHSYTNDYIRFADTKAAIIIALSSALLGSLLTIKAHYFLAPSRFNLIDPSWKGSWLGIGALVAFAFLAAAWVQAMLAIAPRLTTFAFPGFLASHVPFLANVLGKKSPPLSPGLIYWGNILAHGTEDAFWAAISTPTQSQLAEALARHLFVLASISHRKFIAVDRSILFAAIGGIVACLFILFSN